MDSSDGSVRHPQSDPFPTRPSLLARLKNEGDTSGWNRGWEDFFEVYHPLIHRYARTQGLNEADADDVVVTIIDGVRKSLPAFEYVPKRCSFKTWLFRLARNKVADFHRKRYRAEKAPLVVIEDAEMLEAVPDLATLGPDAAWDLEFECSLRRVALERVARRVKPMAMRLYLYHVVDGHDVATTVDHFRSFQARPEDVHQAKHRIQAMADAELEALRSGEPRK